MQWQAKRRVFEVRLSSAAVADALPGHGAKRPRDMPHIPAPHELSSQGGMLRVALNSYKRIGSVRHFSSK